MNTCNTEGSTPLEVRDAIIACFKSAHAELIKNDVDLPDGFNEKFTEQTIINIIKDQIEKNGGDYENPTKESLFYAIIGLSEIAKQFRDVDVIVKHFKQMLELIDGLNT